MIIYKNNGIHLFPEMIFLIFRDTSLFLPKDLFYQKKDFTKSLASW